MFTKCGINFNFMQLSSNVFNYKCPVCLWQDYMHINRILSLQVLRITLLHFLILVFGKTLQGKHARWTFPVWQESWVKNVKDVKCNLQVLEINSANTMHSATLKIYILEWAICTFIDNEYMYRTIYEKTIHSYFRVYTVFENLQYDLVLISR